MTKRDKELGLPWVVCEGYHEFEGWLVGAAPIAGVHHDNWTEAQATLMAAAPELREALKTAVTLLKGMGELIQAACPDSSVWCDEGSLGDQWNDFEALKEAALKKAGL